MVKYINVSIYVNHMSLEDKFYPDDGTPINKFDNAMIKAVGKLGCVYQDWTGATHKEMVAGMDALVYRVGKFTPLAFKPSYKKPSTDICTPMDDQLSDEEILGDKHYSRKARLVNLGITGLCGVCACVWSQVDTSGVFDVLIGLETYCFASLGATQAVLAANNYLSRADIPEPPRKTAPQRFKEQLKKAFEVPQPVYVPADG